MSDIVLKLRNAAQLINEVADELDKASEAPKAKIDFTAVRAVLAKKAADGFKAEVKALLGKFNAEKLSDICPEDYEQLMNEAEGIGNG